jgi:hypothetical protein
MSCFQLLTFASYFTFAIFIIFFLHAMELTMMHNLLLKKLWNANLNVMIGV